LNSQGKVVIVGGGSGGTILANLLSNKGFEVTLINKKTHHLFLPGLLHVAFKGYTRNLVKPLREILKQNVKLYIDEVVEVNLDERYVHTLSNKTIEYDYLVIAGATIDYTQVPGLKEHVKVYGDYYSTIDNALKTWKTLKNFSRGTFAIVVADPTIDAHLPLMRGFSSRRTVQP